MRLATYTAASLVTAAIGATVAYAFFAIEFLVIVVIVLVLSGELLGSPRKKADKVTQKVTFEMRDGFAFLNRGGTGEPDSLSFSGDLTVKKSKPALTSPAPTRRISIAFPITKTNGAETRGSLKAGNDELSGFRTGIDNLLTIAANLEGNVDAQIGGDLGGPGKTTKAFLGGGIQSSDSRQSGSVKVDTKTFSRLSGAVNLKGDAFTTGEPGNFDTTVIKYKLKVKFRPRKSNF